VGTGESAGWVKLHSAKRGLKSFAEVDAAIDDFKAESLVGFLGVCVVDPGVGGHFDAAMTACPTLGLAHEGFADSVATSGLVDEPAFDEADGLGGVAAVGVGAQPYLKKSGECSVIIV
jgi:hypothetical protein